MDSSPSHTTPSRSSTQFKRESLSCQYRHVPRFAAFPGIRYSHDDLGAVTAPPYDVIDDDERGQLVDRHPHNVVRIDLPVGGDDPYADAASTLRSWLDDGVLATDAPSLYLYRMTFADDAGRAHQTLGVIGALGLEPPGTGDVLPHEHTTPKAKSDRLDLLRATKANLSPVWGLSLAGGLSKLLDPSGASLLGAWDDDDGVGHELWQLTDSDAIDAIVEAVSGAPVVIADGHHRYETCLAFASEQADLDNVDATMCFVVELVQDQLTVQPIHRLVRGLPEDFDLLAALEPYFDLVDVEPVDETILEGMTATRWSRGRPTPRQPVAAAEGRCAGRCARSRLGPPRRHARVASHAHPHLPARRAEHRPSGRHRCCASRVPVATADR